MFSNTCIILRCQASINATSCGGENFSALIFKKNLLFQQIEYQKQRKETIDNYRGFQTMDSSDHPVVQRGIKAAELISDVSGEFLYSQ